MTWYSKLQSQIALSSTEVEYNVLLRCLHNIIPTMNLINEISSHVEINKEVPQIKYRLFEDNESCIKAAKALILILRTKHIVLEYHHFRSYVNEGLISIKSIRIDKQNADTLTKSVGDPQFIYLQKKTNGH